MGCVSRGIKMHLLYVLCIVVLFFCWCLKQATIINIIFVYFVSFIFLLWMLVVLCYNKIFFLSFQFVLRFWHIGGRWGAVYETDDFLSQFSGGIIRIFKVVNDRWYCDDVYISPSWCKEVESHLCGWLYQIKI